MAIKLGIGHDTTTTILHLYNSNTSTGSPSAAIIEAATGRNGTACLRMGLTGATNTGDTVRVAKTLPTDMGTIYWGFGFKISSLPGATFTTFLALLRDNGTVQLDLRLRSDGKLIITGSVRLERRKATRAAHRVAVV